MRSKRLITAGIVFAAVTLAAGAAGAQETDEGPRSWGVVQAGTGLFLSGSTTTMLDAGGGAEFVWPNGAGFAIDATFLGTSTDFVLLVSPALIYEFPTEEKLRPYLRAGLTLASFQIPLADLGGGVNYWFHDRFGLKLEARYNLFLEEPDFGFTRVHAGLNIRF